MAESIILLSRAFFIHFERTSLIPLKFRLGLRRFRSEVVSTIHTYAVHIFGITNIATIDDCNKSTQVAALCPNNKFLYKHGNVSSMENFMRSDCIIRVGYSGINSCHHRSIVPQALRVILFGPAALDGSDNQKSQNVRAMLFNVRTVRYTIAAFVATVVSESCVTLFVHNRILV